VQRCGTPENMQNEEENFRNMQTTDKTVQLWNKVIYTGNTKSLSVQ